MPTNGLEPSFSVAEVDLLKSQQIVLETVSPSVVLHPDKSAPRRCWSGQKFAAVGNALAKTGAQVVITGIEQDYDWYKP
ncbi:glycosyltransferase family 9 protein [Leptothermofonsia sp. ETS-13]|uniref:glycosyltransferase family 9 protein n=1 Tax=Leptothermofonsia sp. ETS-13 TaxID=3035696 RepID=UPI003BA00216